MQRWKRRLLYCRNCLENGKRSLLALHFNSQGNKLWEKLISEGINANFTDCVSSPEGDLFLCGTALTRENDNGQDEDWLTVCLDKTGKVNWQKPFDGPGHSHDFADRIALTRSGDVLVAGTFDTGNPAQGGSGRILGLVKYNSAGEKQLWRCAKETGPNVSLNSLSVNFEGSILLGGTRQRDNGNKETV